MYEERANLRATIDASPLWDVDVATRKALLSADAEKAEWPGRACQGRPG